MSWTTPATVTVGQIMTASFWNTQVRDNFSDIDSRDNVSRGYVATSETTTSTSYTNLTTVGPAVTVNTGTTAFVSVTAELFNSGVNSTFATWAVSGATTIAASDDQAVRSVATLAERGTFVGMQTGLTPGSNTFTMKYRVSGGTGTFLYRQILVFPGNKLS